MRWPLYALAALIGLFLIGLSLAAIFVLLAYPHLPSLEVLTDYRPKMPLRVFTADGQLIGEFGEERRSVLPIRDVPKLMQQAIVAAEDERFYEHAGVDTLGVLRAAVANLTKGGAHQGASTITMQVARNFFLSNEKTLTRKAYEVLLAFKIEKNLSKDQILELYLNQIYLGQRAYGFAAAAQTYFGKPLQNISLAEAAMLAGLPKAPSKYNPISNLKRATLRQQYVLRRMRELNFIDDRQLAAAKAEPLQLRRDTAATSIHADYVAEMARQIAYEQFHEEAYTRGLKVFTTILSNEQEAAWAAARRGVLDYDRRHGCRGAEDYIDMTKLGDNADDSLEDALQDAPESEDLRPAAVLEASPQRLKLHVLGGEAVTLSGDALKFCRAMLDDKAPAARRIRRGAMVRVTKDPKSGWQLAQLPEVEAAFVSGDPRNGAIHALIGGFDFNRNKFNRVTQAWRQPGSSFKPFIYSAALEKGYGPSTEVDDAPIVIPASETGSQAWEPKNYDGKYDGMMPLRTALARSKNMVSVRLLRAIGPRYAQDYAVRFGFDADKNPPYLTLALGAGAVSPWQMLTAYSVFANGGYRVTPHIVTEIRDDHDVVLAKFDPPLAGDDSLRVIDARNAYLMDSMLQDVVRRGTATRALALKRSDLAGKTGTTNDYVDAWFCGYSPALVGIAWLGFDQPHKLGNGETGGAAALPIWIAYMEKALAGVPETRLPRPQGLIEIQPGGEGSGLKPDWIYEEQLPAEPNRRDDEAPAPPDAALPPSPSPG
ncbi:MAG: penicillin-binding protein 1A [Rhodocyclaceae bacterium]|nr:penicillin-binding protein 1A [Rhodocyclaceae bacterium]MBX3670406.1 penicillin-binding protein 1A [Rhodocyclaceae bacterium]